MNEDVYDYGEQLIEQLRNNLLRQDYGFSWVSKESLPISPYAHAFIVEGDGRYYSVSVARMAEGFEP